jgi:hypothetical protein
MVALAPNEAEVRNLQKETSTDLDLVLFVNDLTPDEDTEAGDLTEPAHASGAARTIAPGDWTITGGDPTEAVADVEVWTLDSSITTVYGWALVERGTGEDPDVLVRIERFAAPWVHSENGGILAIRPRLTCS